MKLEPQELGRMKSRLAGSEFHEIQLAKLELHEIQASGGLELHVFEVTVNHVHPQFYSEALSGGTTQ